MPPRLSWAPCFGSGQSQPLAQEARQNMSDAQNQQCCVVDDDVSAARSAEIAQSSRRLAVGDVKQGRVRSSCARSRREPAPSCLVLDVFLPGPQRCDLQEAEWGDSGDMHHLHQRLQRMCR